MTSSGRRVLAMVLVSQALRGLGYGLAAVQLGAVLRGQGLDGPAVGLVLAAVVAGSAAASLALGRWGDRFGRVRAYTLLYLALAVSGAILAMGGPAWLVALVALTGALSTEVVESGPFTTLEQVMLAGVGAGQPKLVQGLWRLQRGGHPDRRRRRPAGCPASRPAAAGRHPDGGRGVWGVAGHPAAGECRSTRIAAQQPASAAGILTRAGAAAGRAVRG
jgi:MFS family permease